MKLLLILLSSLALTGCASGCREACVWGIGPGNAMFDKTADYYDRTDPCQTREFSSLTGERLKPEGYSTKDIPKWCGNGQARRTPINVYNNSGQRIAVIK